MHEITDSLESSSIVQSKCEAGMYAAIRCLGNEIQHLVDRDGQNHHMLMILKSKSNHLNIGDLNSKSFWKW